MRRPHRHIEIFSMSVLDMFASALGAFIMCSVILFPYYSKKDVSKELAAATDALSQQKVQLESRRHEAQDLEQRNRRQQQELEGAHRAQVELTRCHAGLNQCQVALAKTFLLITVEWDMKVNVDLHVTDPRGNEFYWFKPNKDGRDFPENP